ncbi:MAG TPA: bifunctional alpha/beta hydrolase/OsmC family protein [Hyphomicrobiaceae bacterium]|nr:bifunctional alpha/beta hydrolase/OsmC family protein [Hyphomicrobiaceae bacterium]
MPATTVRTTFPGHSGEVLVARLDLPAGPVRGYALFAHCFTCSMDLFAARTISQGLAQRGIGVLRFDFTGLGSSEGEFANTNFSSNVQDLIAAARHLGEHHAAPDILIGHSLGGAAVLAAAGELASVKAVATIGAPADVGHVLHNFGSSLDEIKARGAADVSLAGRRFRIERQFVEDAEGQRLKARIGSMRKALLVMHAPLDQTVGINNASEIFVAAKHPKSFVSLDDADHLLSDHRDASYAAGLIAAWAERYLPAETQDETAHHAVVVSETGIGRFQNAVLAGRHRLLADEPRSVGGLDSGPSPYDYLSAALGSCTAMTLRMYADRKKLELGRVTVEVLHGKAGADHCEECGEAAEGRSGKIDRFERIISVDGVVDWSLNPELEAKLVEIAGKCPVHRTLEAASAVVTRIRRPNEGS